MNPMRSAGLWKWGSAAVAALLISCFCWYFLRDSLWSGEEVVMPRHVAEKAQDSSAFVVRQEEFKAPREPIRRTAVICKGDSVFGILLQNGIPRAQANEIIDEVKKTFDLARVRPGHEITLVFSPDNRELTGLEYAISDRDRLMVAIDGDSVEAALQPASPGLAKGDGLSALELSVRYERAEGTISSSLYESAVQSGVPPEIVMGLTDIFAWDINFFTDIREGDAFTVLYERYYEGNTSKGYGRIVAARFMNRANEHVAVYYTNGGSVEGYYDSSGRPIRKLFLKAPLNYRRISSGFSHHRMDPVFSVARPHHGVDYAAPSGTPVVALGQGKVIFKGWSKELGKCIQIRHPSGHVSCYGHLSGFPEGISRGAKVDLGEVIGYVGKTGDATGPHLDFRVRVGGSFLNPLTLRAGNGPALKGEALARFRQVSTERLSMLDDSSLNYTMKLSTRY